MAQISQHTKSEELLNTKLQEVQLSSTQSLQQLKSQIEQKNEEIRLVQAQAQKELDMQNAMLKEEGEKKL